MERDPDERDVELLKTAESIEDTADASQAEDAINGGDSAAAPEPSGPLDQTAADALASSRAPSASDSKKFESDSEPQLDSPQAKAPSDADAATESTGNVAPIELPAGVTISPTRPADATHDRHSHLLPLDPTQDSAREPDSVDQIFPPEMRLPAGSGGLIAPRRPAASGGEGGQPADRGHTMPRLQVLVNLADARAMFEEVVDQALAHASGEFEEIVQAEIRLYDFRQENKRRAADPRLRGPG